MYLKFNHYQELKLYPFAFTKLIHNFNIFSLKSIYANPISLNLFIKLSFYIYYN